MMKHKYILIALAAIAVIALGASVYYYEGTNAPAVSVASVAHEEGSSISASGVVEPLQNPDLSFASAGRVTRIAVSAGDRVYAGETLATLDIAALSAQKAQALAGQKAAEARLDALKAPPRDTDVAVRQSAVTQAMQARAATYASIPAALSDAYAKSVDAVHVNTDTVFSNPNSVSPSLAFNTSDSSSGANAVSGRVTAGAELSTWYASLTALPAAPSESELDHALNDALTHLTVVRSFEDAVIAALNVAIPTSTFTSSSIASAQGSVSAARATVNGLISSLTATTQTLISQKLAIQSAEVALNQLNAGASSQDIAAAEAAVESAQANVAAVSAQIANNIITAPFSGTVGSVSVKAGELASMNTPVVTLIPDSGLQVSVSVTEIDAAHIAVGDIAAVTLDAYGTGRVFPAHVSALDSAPSTIGGVRAYRVKLTFDRTESDVKTGMTANVIINPSH